MFFKRLIKKQNYELLDQGLQARQVGALKAMPQAETASFSKLNYNSDQDAFISNLLISNKYELQYLLANQSVFDLFQIHNYLKKIQQMPGLYDYSRLEKLIESQFALRLLQDPDFVVIQENARLYLKGQQKPEQKQNNFFTSWINKAKNKLNSALGAKSTESPYLLIYERHLSYIKALHAKELLMKDFATLSANEKDIFIEELLKLPDSIKSQILISQSINDITELELKCLAAQAKSHELKKEDLTKIYESLNANIAAFLNNWRTAIGSDSHLSELAQAYLENNKDILVSITAHTVDKEEIRDCVILPADTAYSIHIQLVGKDDYTSYAISEDKILQFASAHCASLNKQVVKQLLFQNV